MIEIVKDYWAVIASFVGLIVWLARLEARGLSNAKEIKHLWDQRKEDFDTAVESRKEINRQLDIISNDIKQLLINSNR